MNIRSKYIIFGLLFIAFAAILMVSCRTSKDKKKSKLHMEDNIISAVTDSGSDILDATVHERYGYMVSQDGIIRYDLASGQKEVLTAAGGNTSICADGSNLYTYNKEENTVIKLDLNGKVLDNYPFTYDAIDADRMIIYEDTIIIASCFVNDDGYSESELYKLDLSSGEVSKIPPEFKGKDTYSLIKGLDFIDKNTLMITSCASTSAWNMVIKGYLFDLKKEKVTEEFFLPVSAAYSYDAENSYFYYISGGTIKKYNPKSDDEITLEKLDISAISKHGSGENSSYYIEKIFYANENVILWDYINSLLLVVDLSSEMEPVKIIYSDKALVHFGLDYVIDLFEEETGCPVQTQEYSHDTFSNKLRTKLLASDSDFDIILLYEPTKDNLLSAILKNELYEPLDGYSGIIENFSNMYDGIREMMSHNGKLFGIPSYLRIYSTLSVDYDLLKYGYTLTGIHWSIDDLWTLCEKMVESDEQDVSVYEISNIILLVDMFIQDSINRNDFSKEKLSELLANIKKYYDAGVLYTRISSRDEDNTKISIMKELYMYFDAFVTHRTLPDYPEYGTVMLPEFGGKNYSYLEGCIFVNKASNNKEMAVKFLEVLTRSDNIYNTKDLFNFTMLGRDLTKYDIYQDWSPNELAYLSDLPYIYENAGIYTFDYLDLNNFLNENLKRELLNGSISVEEAADMIYDRVKYTYFE